MTTARYALCFTAAALLASAASAQMIAPDSATTASQFSGSYDIGNVIDGSGLPVGFTPTSSHNIYVQNNHWTTQAGALQDGNARASFFFNTARTIHAFNMWNHRSTTGSGGGVGADTLYGVTRFNLILRDAGGAALLSLLNQAAIPGYAVAQNFYFPPIAGVRQVDFTIVANNGSTNYTGLAEVRFNGVVVPCGLSDIAGPGQAPFPDQALTADDIIVFLNRFFAGDLASNVAGPGQDTVALDAQLTADDIIVFLNRFFAGC